VVEVSGSISYINFTPTAASAVSFQATCDGTQYNFFCPWNTFGQRWYIQCTDQSNNLIFYLPLIGSGSVCFPLAALSWSNLSGGSVTAETLVPHGFPVGTQPTLVIGGCTPTGYNGSFPCNILTATSFTYPLTTYPGVATALGAVFDSVNLAAGYFTTTRIVYRQPLAQVEIDNSGV
jgi:hypothetical protein